MQTRLVIIKIALVCSLVANVLLFLLLQEARRERDAEIEDHLKTIRKEREWIDRMSK